MKLGVLKGNKGKKQQNGEHNIIITVNEYGMFCILPNVIAHRAEIDRFFIILRDQITERICVRVCKTSIVKNVKRV